MVAAEVPAVAAAEVAAEVAVAAVVAVAAAAAEAVAASAGATAEAAEDNRLHLAAAEQKSVSCLSQFLLRSCSCAFPHCTECH